MRNGKHASVWAGILFAGTAVMLSAGPAPGQTVLFADTFDRADSEDLNAATDGKSGTLGALDWVEMSFQGTLEVLNNELEGGDNAARGGWVIAYPDHNFVDAAISSGGGFRVSIDLVHYATAGGVRHMGIAVGMSQAEVEGWSQNNPENLDYVDLFVGYRGTTLGGRVPAIEAFESGELVIHNPDAGGPATLPKTLVVDFSLSSFDEGSKVDYVITFGGVEMGTGSFEWSGTNENYIAVYSNLSNRQGRMDNFSVTALGSASPYDDWAGDAAFDEDTSGDGIANGVAWVLGAQSPHHDTSALLPTIDTVDDEGEEVLVFTFPRLRAAEDDSNTEIEVEYSSDLSDPGGWDIAVHDGDDIIISQQAEGDVDIVTVRFKTSTLAADGRLFVRLRVARP